MTVRSLNSLLGAAIVLVASSAANARPRALAAVLAAISLVVMTTSGVRSLQTGFLRPDVKTAVNSAASLRPPATIVLNLSEGRYATYLPPSNTNTILRASPSATQWEELAASGRPLVWLTALRRTVVSKPLLQSWVDSAVAHNRRTLCSRLFDGNPPVLVLTAWPSGTPASRTGKCDLTAFDRAVQAAPAVRTNLKKSELVHASQRPAPSDIVTMAVLASALALLGAHLWTLSRREAKAASRRP